MIYQIQQDTSLWEAWVEFDDLSLTNFGTLFVMGEALAGKGNRKPQIIKSVDEHYPQRLILKIQSPASDNRLRNTEIMYSEPIKNIDQYSSIVVFKDNDPIAEIEEIEILV